MPDAVPILEFEAVTTVPEPGASAHLSDFSLSMGAGELALIRFDPRAGHGPVPDAAMGLVEPERGQVRFQGESWSSLRPAEVARHRGQIGRLFGRRGWVYHLDVDENVTLRERHHTHRPLRDIEAEAHRLAVALGLPDGLPTGRPGNVDPEHLQRAACVRMLLGSPRLIIVDEPAAGLPAPLSDALATEVRAARAGGSAVVWMTADERVWHGRALRATRRLERAAHAHADVTSNADLGVRS
jgi:phospholipid/cholesterol/gamma-HCH transport system ATP-binding protein